jgi:hypothetical protein
LNAAIEVPSSEVPPRRIAASSPPFGENAVCDQAKVRECATPLPLLTPKIVTLAVWLNGVLIGSKTRVWSWAEPGSTRFRLPVTVPPVDEAVRAVISAQCPAARTLSSTRCMSPLRRVCTVRR